MLWSNDVVAALGAAGQDVRERIASAGLTPLEVRFGDCISSFELLNGVVVLSAASSFSPRGDEGRAPRHVPPVAVPRRLAGRVLEAHYLWALAQHTQRPLGFDWVWSGWAADRCDRALPSWHLGEASLAEALVSGEVGAVPRRGVAVMKAWRTLGVDVDRRVVEIVRDGLYPSSTEWLQVVRCLADRQHGPAAELGAMLPAPKSVDAPVALSPWSWCHVRPPTPTVRHRLCGEEGVSVADAWFVTSNSGSAMASAAASGGRVTVAAGGPVGRWDLVGVQTGQGIVGGRGVVLALQVDGLLELVTEDAVVGPCAALTTGTSARDVFGCSWEVVGERRVKPRFADPQPTGSLQRLSRIHSALCGLLERPWEWLRRGDRLFLRTRDDRGGEVELRWRRVT